jgi:YD repeat-containing protein
MKNNLLLKNLLLLVVGVLLSLSEAVGYRMPMPAGNLSAPLTSYKANHCLGLPSAPKRESRKIAQPHGLPTFEIAEPKIERCWGDPAVFTVTSVNNKPNEPLPSGVNFVLFENDPQDALVSTTNLDVELPMPSNAQPNIPMQYIIVVTDGNGNYGYKLRVYVTWHYISNQIAIDAGYSGAAPYLQNYPIQFVAEANNTTYEWHWGDGKTDTFNGANTAIHHYEQTGTYSITVIITTNYKVPGGQCTTTGTLNGVEVVVPLCELSLPSTGNFQQNTRSGAISFLPTVGNCQPVVSLECLGESILTKQVVAATATAFTDQLPATLLAGVSTTNPYLAGQWRTTPQASYSFRSSLEPDTHNYSAGTFTLQQFDWESSLRARPAAWLTAAVTEQISVHGDVLQERDPLGIPSAAKFSYGAPRNIPTQVLPYLQAHNAEYPTVFFESFENVYPMGGVMMGEDGYSLPGNATVSNCDIQASCPLDAHTGNSCALVGEYQLKLMPVIQNVQLNASGLLIKAWVRYQQSDGTAISLSELPSSSLSFARLDAQNNLTNLAFSAEFKPMIQTGDWVLFEARFPTNTMGLVIGDRLIPTIMFGQLQRRVNNIPAKIWVDDLRVQPADAQMTTYVYDPVSLRLVASFDDQHFALRYQYNAEGKLIRKQADTERGLKTLQETHYHTPASTQVDE